MRTGIGTRGVICAAVAAAMLVGASSASATMAVQFEGIKGGKALPNQKVTMQGTTEPGIPVAVELTRGAEKPETFNLNSNSAGKFSLPIFVKNCCTFKVVATSAGGSQGASFNVQVPKLHKGSKGPQVALFHSLLREQGYFVRGKKRYGASTELAVLAFRKVNKMKRQTRYSRAIYRALLQGRGAFPLQHPDEGKHVETDLSRQVMVLAEDGKPKHTFHISSGTGATPTVTGKFSFYMKTPGYNAKRMYYSAYFIGGYATHGYNPVPNYPASHGCLRNPIADSVFIYNWINIGDTIYVYH